ncbi:MAG: aldo/keto reductase [Ruminococcus sp.]
MDRVWRWLALSWILRKETVTSVIMGRTQPAPIQDALRVVNRTPLTEAELGEIERILATANAARAMPAQRLCDRC